MTGLHNLVAGMVVSAVRIARAEERRRLRLWGEAFGIPRHWVETSTAYRARIVGYLRRPPYASGLLA